MSSLLEVFFQFFALGCTSFGGPVAHLGYFHERFVQREQWLSADAFTDLVALCQLLPGPSSSQLGMGIGLIRAGWLGGLVAWVGFTLPSAVLMVLAAGLLSDQPAWLAGGCSGCRGPGRSFTAAETRLRSRAGQLDGLVCRSGSVGSSCLGAGVGLVVWWIRRSSGPNASRARAIAVASPRGSAQAFCWP